MKQNQVLRGLSHALARDMDASDREYWRARIADLLEAEDEQGQPTNGIAFVVECMEYSRFGPLAMAFMIDAITKHAEAVAETDPAELAKLMEVSPVHPQSWQGVAKEIKDKFDKFFNRNP